jgi:cardiolipin synthase A/B
MTLLLIGLAHLAGLASAPSALLTARTPQAAVGWVVALVTLPWVAVPLYWTMGSSRFAAYVRTRQRADAAVAAALKPEMALLAATWGDDVTGAPAGLRALAAPPRLPALRGNTTRLLLDGEATFQDLFAGIEGARSSVLLQFYTLAEDGIGGALGRLLEERVRAGVAVHLLFDRVGSHRLRSRYIQRLRAAGVHIGAFRTSSPHHRAPLQFNLRNHRKAAVVDGRVAWLGGANVSDAYLGLDPATGRWRDTQLRLEGPAALAVQLSFCRDWHWSTGELPAGLDWGGTGAPPGGLAQTGRPPESAGETVMVLPSGPSDASSRADLLVQQLIHSGEERIWISTPYFVPDEAVIGALRLAAFRGVDVRLLVPERSDTRLVDSAAFPPLELLEREGVRVYRYQRGFLHAKTIVVDSTAAAVGSLNFDYRSFLLNYEITALLLDPEAVRRVADSFTDDLAQSKEMSSVDFARRSTRQRLASRGALLVAPLL